MTPKTLVLLAISLVALASGVTGQLLYPGLEFAPSEIWFILGSWFLVFVWYRLDSEQVGYPRSVWLNTGIIAIGLVAVPYYLFRTRGLRRGALAVVLYVVAVVAWSLLVGAGQYAAWYGVQS